MLHFAHHLGGLVELLEEAVERYDVHTCSTCNTRFATTIQQTRVSTLCRCHGVNHRLDGFERIIADFDTFERFVHARNHAHQVFHRTHFLDLRELTEEIVEVKLVLGYFLADTPCFSFVVLLLRTLHEADDITHTENTVRHTCGMEHIECFHFFARTDELNRFVHYRADRKRSTATGVTVQFGEYDTIEIDAVVELFGGVHRILTGHGIDHEECFGRCDSVFDSRNLLHHLLVNRQTTGCIDDDNVVSEFLRFSDSRFGFLHRIRFVQAQIDVRFNLLTQYAQLLDSGRTIDVARHQHDAFILLGLEIISQFGGKSSLTGTLETGHKNDRRRTFEIQFLRFATHQFCQLVVRNLHHQLSRTHGSNHVLSERFLFHAVGKLLGCLVVNIGFQQRFADVLHRLGDVYLGDTSFTFQDLKRPF